MKAFQITRCLQNISRSQYMITAAKQIEEESLLHYTASSFYPVHIGQTFRGRYEVEVKLGFGTSSTVWLCNDKKDNSYKVLKVGTRRKAEDRESAVLAHLKKSNSSHDGRYCVRRLCDSFEVEGPGGAHRCLIYEPLGRSLLEYVNIHLHQRVSMKAVAWIATYLLQGLDYLHSCHVVHTDIKLDNILTTLPDDEDAILANLINSEHRDPSPRKAVDENITIYTSRTPEYSNELTYPIICDLGMAVFNKDEYDGIIQPIPYRAPEVILRMKWNTSADIWNLGVLIWELLFSEHLFGNETEKNSLKKMIEYLGPPPKQFLERNILPSLYFDEVGTWRGNDLIPISLHDRLEGADVELFLVFILSMLRWDPEERGSAGSLLKHPWLNHE